MRSMLCTFLLLSGLAVSLHSTAKPLPAIYIQNISLIKAADVVGEIDCRYSAHGCYDKPQFNMPPRLCNEQPSDPNCIIEAPTSLIQ